MKSLRARLEVLELRFGQVADAGQLDALVGALDGDEQAVAEFESLRAAGKFRGTRLPEVFESLYLEGEVTRA